MATDPLRERPAIHAWSVMHVLLRLAAINSLSKCGRTTTARRRSSWSWNWMRWSSILPARSSNENRVHHCADTGGFDDDCHATWTCSYESVVRRNNERGATGFVDRREPSGDGSKPRPGGAGRHRILSGRRKHGRHRGQRQAPWLDHYDFGQHQRAGAVQFSAGPARPPRL